MEHEHNQFPLWHATNHQSQDVPSQPSRSAESATSQRGRVAVVEDGESTRHFLLQHLRAEGYLVKGIEDGGSALPLLRLHQPDVILLDVSLPGLSGFEVCQQIRSDPLLREARVIMLTGYASGGDHVNAWRAGANDYVVKPCEIPELLACVAAHMGHRDAPMQQWLSPITRLPAAAALEDDLVGRVRRAEPFAVCFVDIAYFRSYNHRYGYVAGNALLVVLADLLRDIASDLNGHTSAADKVLAGHLGSDDFLLITPPNRLEEAHQLLLEGFSKIAPSLYQSVDRDRGWVPGTDYLGAAQQFPLVQLVTATRICQPEDFPLDSEGQPEEHIISQMWPRMLNEAQGTAGLRPTG